MNRGLECVDITRAPAYYPADFKNYDYDREQEMKVGLKSEDRGFVILMGALVTVLAGLGTMSYVDHTAKGKFRNALSSAFNDAAFHLEGAHAVTANYEGRNYTYNFNNKTVLGGQTRGVGFGGAGYGGMVSFENFEDQTAIETARTQGCKIAKNMQTAENPGFPVWHDFEYARKQAARFAASYCP